MTDKITIARIKKFGKTFEICVNPDTALKYKEGNITDLREVLLADNVFSDANKGLVAPNSDLEEAFKTTNFEQIADLIIKHGEIHLTSEHRAKERERHLRKLINLIHQQGVDPRTGFPHPLTRIEAALEEAKIHLDSRQSVEEQFNGILLKLRPILPIRIEQKQLTITVPSQYTGKTYQFVKNNSKVLKEEWISDGSWRIKTEIPAGFQQEFIDKLNSITHGEIQIENE